MAERFIAAVDVTNHKHDYSTVIIYKLREDGIVEIVEAQTITDLRGIPYEELLVAKSMIYEGVLEKYSKIKILKNSGI